MLPKLEEWNAIFISHGNRRTAGSLPSCSCRGFFRANTSGALWGAAPARLPSHLKDAPEKKFHGHRLRRRIGGPLEQTPAFEEQIQEGR